MIKKLHFEGFVWLSLSVFLGVQSIKLGIGSASAPGPGFMPFIFALILFLLSLLLLIIPIISQKEKVRQKLDLRISVFSIAFSIGVYVLIFKKIGYLFATFLLMTILFKYMGTKKWLWALAEAFLATISSYLFFKMGLGLNLPDWIF